MDNDKTNNSLWAAAKVSTAIRTSRKKDRNPQTPKTRVRKRSKSANDITSLQSSEDVRKYIEMLNKCPLISSPQIMRHVRRKDGVCERDENDRVLVRKCMKYFMRLSIIDDQLCGLIDTK